MLKKIILSIVVILMIMTITGNSQIINLSNSSNTASVHPWVVGFDNGKVMVVWMEGCQADKVNPRDIWYTRYANGSWSTPGAAFPNPAKIAKNPHLEVASNGVVHLVWGEDDPDRDVFHGTYSNGAWRNKTKIYDSPYNSNWMKVGILADGTVNVNWCSGMTAGLTQYWRTRNTWKPVGAGWVGTAPYISKNTPYNYGTDGWDLAMHPGIACRGTKTYAVWHEGNHSKMTVKFAYKTGNGTFSNPVNVWPTGSLYYRPDIVVDSNNNVHIICFKGANVHYKGLINGSWTEDRLVSGGGVIKGFVDIDIDSNDNLHAVYQVGTRIFYNTGTKMGVWGDEIAVSNGSDDQHSSCDAADDGYVHIVWCTHDETEDSNVMYTRIQNPNWGEITVTSPKADDVYAVGGTIPFEWTSRGISGDVTLVIANVQTKTKYNAGTVPYNSSPHNYDIPQVIPPGYYIGGAIQGAVKDKTGIFTIKGINITSDHTGKNYGVGSSIPVTWTADGMTGNINVNLITSDNGTTIPLETVPYNGSPHNFLIPPGTPMGSYYIKMSQSPAEDSTGIFNLVTGSIEVTSPTGGTFNSGDTVSIAWTTVGIEGNVKLTLWKSDNSQSYPINDSVPKDASPYSIAVPCAVPSGTYYVKVESGTISGISANFTVEYNSTATLTLTRPNGGEVERAGTIQTVTWTSTGTIANVMIEFSPDNGDHWTLLEDSTPNTGTYTNLVPPDSNTYPICKLRISDVAGCASDESDGTFTILPADVMHIFSPVGGEVFSRGQDIPIGFTTSGLIGNVKIYLYQNKTNYFYVGEYPVDQTLLYYTIPAGASTGQYIIGIKKDGIVRRSGIFTIN